MPYAELHCKTNYSLLEGASHADELAARAAELKLHSLAVTDRNSLAGVVRAHVAAKEAGLRLEIGAEIVPVVEFSAGSPCSKTSELNFQLSHNCTSGPRRSLI